jgi:hypothetical protein
MGTKMEPINFRLMTRRKPRGSYVLSLEESKDIPSLKIMIIVHDSKGV